MKLLVDSSLGDVVAEYGAFVGLTDAERATSTDGAAALVEAAASGGTFSDALGLLLVAGGCNPPFSLQGKGRVAPPQGHSTWSQQALVLLEAMQEEGLVPNVISYNAGLDSFGGDASIAVLSDVTLLCSHQCL